MQGREPTNKEDSIVSYKDDKCREEKESRRGGIQNAGGEGAGLSFPVVSLPMPNQYSNVHSQQIEINIGKKNQQRK